MQEVSPVADYPTESGCFLRGNDYPPVAVVVLLNAPYGTLPPEVLSIPPEIEKLVRVAIETGAALSGTLQTENIGVVSDGEGAFFYIPMMQLLLTLCTPEIINKP